jgi:hypothetical protein
MGFPNKYVVTYSYTGFAQALGNGSFPGTQVDTDLSDLKRTTDEIIAFLSGVTRSDGALKNGVVTVDALSNPVKAMIGEADALADIEANLNAMTANLAASNADVVSTHADVVLTNASAAAAAASLAAMPAAFTSTSTTSLVIAIGSKVFTTQAGKQWTVGMQVIAASTADPINFMHGAVTAYSGTTLTVLVNDVGGSGTFADWRINISGTQGPGASVTAPITLTNDGLSTIIQRSAAGSHALTQGAASSVNLNGFGSGPAGQVKFTPSATGAHNALDVRGVNSRVQLTAQGGAANPSVVLSDTNVLGSVVPGGHNIAGIGMEITARVGGGPSYVNIINKGVASGSGADQSATLNIWGTSTLGDTQNAIMFFNGTGTNLTSGTLTATTAGYRLGEIGGFASLPDGKFTETETWSINGYAEITTTGITNDGSYKAPSNIVFRTAPNTNNPERTAMVVDYNANLLVGAGWSHFNNGIAGPGSAIYVRGKPANVGAVNLKWDPSVEQGISLQTSNNLAGNAMLIHNFAGTQIGSISVTTTNTAFNTSSDRRLKTNISATEVDVGSVIDALQVVDFEFKQDLGERKTGFIAQDLHAVWPQAVTSGDDRVDASPTETSFKTWGLDYSKLVPLLVKEVQSLRRRMAELDSH